MKITTGLILLYIVSFYIAYKIFQPEIKKIITTLKTLKKSLYRKMRRINTNKKI